MSIDANAVVPVDQIGLGPADADVRLLEWLRLLADGNRLRIFLLLRQGERCVCDIESAVQLPQNLVSHHLKVMREAGLTVARKDGRWVYHRINKAQLEQLFLLMHGLFDPALVSDAAAAC
jgi:ArsR family transcriptional regulator, arsenate/arsenite/antimonite-responsive transcriptional repressor